MPRIPTEAALDPHPLLHLPPIDIPASDAGVASDNIRDFRLPATGTNPSRVMLTVATVGDGHLVVVVDADETEHKDDEC